MKKLGLIVDKNRIETWICFIQNTEFISPTPHCLPASDSMESLYKAQIEASCD